MLKSHIVFLFILSCSLLTQAQNVRIELQNPSFEDIPRHSRPPQGWFDCGMEGETPPDVQPGSFSVKRPAQHGNTYLGLVTRDNETWEAVGQRLSSPFVGGRCYQFKIYLSYSDEYLSQTKNSLDYEFFIKPVKLRVWGGNGYCDKREMLGESDIVNSTEWVEQQLILKPKKSYKYIVLEAFYKTPTLFPYNGNLLVDNASPIVMKESCDDEWNENIMEDRPLAINTPPKKDEPNTKPKPKPSPKPKPKKDKPKKDKPNTDTPPIADVPPIEPRVEVVPAPEKETITPELSDVSQIKEGQTIRIQKLKFAADDFAILEESEPSLDEIYDFMQKHPKVIIEIGGHTNRLPSTEYCNWLSSYRAESVREYLVGKGITEDRISAKGYGKTEPIDVSNTARGRKRNQRVEIKIISLEG